MRPLYGPGHDASTGLLLIRLIAAAVFIYHGCQILFGLFSGPGPAAFASSMHLPLWVGYAVGAAQLGGGLALATGILFTLGCLGILVVMIGAIYLVHWKNGFNIIHGGMEYALTQAVVALGLALTGPGIYVLWPRPRTVVAEPAVVAVPER